MYNFIYLLCLQVKRDLNVQNVLKGLCGVITFPNTSRLTRIRKEVGQLLPLWPRENWTHLSQRCLALHGLSQLQPFLKIRIQQLPMFQQTWKNFEMLFVTKTSRAALKFTHRWKSGNGLVKWIQSRKHVCILGIFKYSRDFGSTQKVLNFLKIEKENQYYWKQRSISSWYKLL